VEASDEQEAFSDKFECNNCSWRRSTEEKLPESDLGDKLPTVGTVRTFFSSPNLASSGDFPSFLNCFEAGFRALVNGPALVFPVGPNTGLASESATFIDLTLGAPDIVQTNFNLTLFFKRSSPCLPQSHPRFPNLSSFPQILLKLNKITRNPPREFTKTPFCKINEAPTSTKRLNITNPLQLSTSSTHIHQPNPEAPKKYLTFSTNLHFNHH
jgi:hypothetical protein